MSRAARYGRGERGRNLDKVGMHAQDTSELFFSDVRVPAANLLGPEGGGFVGLMQNLPRPGRSRGHVRDHAGVLQAAAGVRAADRQVQHNRFVLAEMVTELAVARAFTDKAVLEHNAGRLSNEDASMVKWWDTELCNRVVDRCLQLHGGYGYMREYQVARAFADGRVQTIFGGTTEIMKEIIGRGLGV
jgi:acyl-CoA dehydrogenase